MKAASPAPKTNASIKSEAPFLPVFVTMDENMKKRGKRERKKVARRSAHPAFSAQRNDMEERNMKEIKRKAAGENGITTFFRINPLISHRKKRVREKILAKARSTPGNNGNAN